ncbi:MAG TPA: ATP-binding protein, partial [Amnibacterium sp.]|uniref:ATP-binding protein n=1 Tax=Amnibacterium sp. TaxID=1872496 RepID=UPI002F93B97D
MVNLVGRDRELAELLAAVRRPGPGIVTLVGAPGMGKTALLHALLRVVDAPFVLTARPLPTETGLAFTGLIDLLTDLPASVYADLPGPQRASLRAALLLEEVQGGADPRAVAAGVRSALAHLAEKGPVLLVLDDAQWLDAASRGALSQALDRIGAAPVVLVCAARPSSSALDWLPTAGMERLTEVWLGPLPAEDLIRVVDDLGLVMERAELRGIERASAGNPLHALELARHRLSIGGGVTIEQLVQERLTVLPRETRIVLLTAALASDPHLEVIARARSCRAVELAAVLDPALRSGLVSVGDLVLFAHPLYAEAAVSAASAPDRAEAHRRLAVVEPSEEARARHAGLATEGPDERLGSVLAAAAELTRAQGAWDTAVDLMTLAVTRTPLDSAERPGRAVRLAEWAMTGGRPSLAERWFREVRTLHRASPVYWPATIGLARLCLLSAERDELHALNRELLGADLDPPLAAEAMIRTVHEEFADRPEGELEHIRLANRVLAEAAERVNPTLLLAGLSLEIEMSLVLGLPTADLLTRAVEVDAGTPALVALDGPSLQLAHIAMMADRFDQGRALCHGMLQRCKDVGDEVSLPMVYSHLGHLEQRAGRWEIARGALIEGEQWAHGQGQLSLWQLRAQGAMIDGLRGDPVPALATLREAAELFAAAEFMSFRAIVRHLTGRVHAAYDEHEAAFEAFGDAIDCARKVGWDD